MQQLQSIQWARGRVYLFVLLLLLLFFFVVVDLRSITNSVDKIMMRMMADILNRA